jgi:hypothetical protein
MAPDLAPLPAARADAHRLFDGDPSLAERIQPFVEVKAAEKSLTERAFEPGMGAAFLDSAEANAVSFGHPPAVSQVRHEVVVLGPAILSLANGVVGFLVVGVESAKVSSAVLATMLRLVRATRKATAELAVPRRLHRCPLSLREIVR